MVLSSRTNSDKNADEFARSLVYGEAALSYIKGHKTPAYPRNYELWYTYAAGYNRELNTAINQILKTQKTISPEAVETFYADYLSPLRHADRIGKVGDDVSVELNAVLDMLDGASGDVVDYGASLTKATSNLDSADSHQQIRAIIDHVLAETVQMTSKNEDLQRQLHESRGQIVELQESLEAIRFESMTDDLTGLSNRRHFDEALNRAIVEARERRSDVSLIMCDIDHFKRFNDTYGHQTGDQVLRLVASSIKMNVKGQDVAARYGGEEFGIILPATEIRDAETVAEHIRVAIQSKELVKRSTGENLGHVTMSFGIASLAEDDTAHSLVERADMCLYASKRAGRNRVTPEDAPIMAETQDVA